MGTKGHLNMRWGVSGQGLQKPGQSADGSGQAPEDGPGGGARPGAWCDWSKAKYQGSSLPDFSPSHSASRGCCVLHYFLKNHRILRLELVSTSGKSRENPVTTSGWRDRPGVPLAPWAQPGCTLQGFSPRERWRWRGCRSPLPPAHVREGPDKCKHPRCCGGHTCV